MKPTQLLTGGGTELAIWKERIDKGAWGRSRDSLQERADSEFAAHGSMVLCENEPDYNSPVIL